MFQKKKGVYAQVNRDPLPVKAGKGRPGQSSIVGMLRPRDAAPRETVAAAPAAARIGVVLVVWRL